MSRVGRRGMIRMTAGLHSRVPSWEMGKERWERTRRARGVRSQRASLGPSFIFATGSLTRLHRCIRECIYTLSAARPDDPFIGNIHRSCLSKRTGVEGNPVWETIVGTPSFSVPPDSPLASLAIRDASLLDFTAIHSVSASAF